MHGDFSRLTFDPAAHFSGVWSQQGRVQLDADANEQAAIARHYLRTLAADLIGPFGYPRHEGGDGPGGGFVVGVGDRDLTVGAGRMYVEGILAENDQATTYWQQPDGHLDPDTDPELPTDEPYLVYLRLWERLVTAVSDPRLREVALGDHGPDTCARSRVVWQVAVSPFEDQDIDPDTALEWLRERYIRTERTMPRLAASAKRPDDADANVCDTAPESRYRGPENQLYRVEVHSGGSAGEATFKWSRENGSVLFPVADVAGRVVTLAVAGRDTKLGLDVGDWVELVDDASASRVADDVPVGESPGTAPRLHRVTAIDPVDLLVTLDSTPAGHCGADPTRRPFLRRWDHQPPPRDGKGDRRTSGDGAVPVDEDRDIDLEDGVRIRFVAAENADGASTTWYRRGDYWLIPARAVTGDVEWPQADGRPAPLPPHGVPYSYAPLAYVSSDGAVDLRKSFPPLATWTARDNGKVDDTTAASKPTAKSAAGKTTAGKAPATPTKRATKRGSTRGRRTA